MCHFVLVFVPVVILTINLVTGKDDNSKGQLLCRSASEAMNKEALQAVLTKESKDVDEKIKCILKCHFQKLKVLRDDGSIDEEVVFRHFVPESALPYIKEIKRCLQLKGENLCDTAFIMGACLLKTT